VLRDDAFGNPRFPSRRFERLRIQSGGSRNTFKRRYSLNSQAMAEGLRGLGRRCGEDRIVRALATVARFEQQGHNVLGRSLISREADAIELRNDRPGST
jgi:hypothetical protein